MGIYLNPKNKGFQEAVCSEIYVDKTELIAYTNKCLNTEEKYICVSRPRRFGKSMTLKMLAAYYSRGCDSKKLFAGYKIESDKTFHKYLNQYDVIYLNMQQFLLKAKTKLDSVFRTGCHCRYKRGYTVNIFQRRRQILFQCWNRFMRKQTGNLFF